MRLKCIIGSFAHFLFFGIIVVSAIPSFFVYAFLLLLKKDVSNFFQQVFAYDNKIFFIIAPKIVVKFKKLPKLPKSALYISTHQSILDYPILTLFVKKHTMLAKINFKVIPLVNFFSNLVGVESIAEKNLEEIGYIYENLEKKLHNEGNIILFPEGTRHEGSLLNPFKRGAFRLSSKTNKPIVPVVIEGLTKILPRKSFCFITTQRTVIYVKVLNPIYPKDFKNDIEMMQHAQKLMQEEKERLCELS
jgi:1-acyl-sn-glycerol-3-phosphate acyltransferase